MKALEIFENALGTAPKRPAREGSRPSRGHEPVARYKVNEVSAETKKSYKEKATQQVKELEPHAKKGEYKDIAKRMIDRREKGLGRVKDLEEGTAERSQNRLWAQITDYEKRAKATKNDIRKQHYLKMADQLRGQLKTSNNEQGVAEAFTQAHADKNKIKYQKAGKIGHGVGWKAYGDDYSSLVGDIIDKFDNITRLVQYDRAPESTKYKIVERFFKKYGYPFELFNDVISGIEKRIAGETKRFEEQGMAEGGYQDDSKEREENLRYTRSRNPVADAIRKRLNPNQVPDKEQGVAEGHRDEDNPFEKGSMGDALWKSLKTKKASPAQQQRNRERFAKRDAEKAKQQGVAEGLPVCEYCGHKHERKLDERGKASRSLCLSSRSDDEIGASALASCKSQGLRARDGKKSHKLGKTAKSRIKVDGHKIKGNKYGGPLPDWS